VSVTAGRLALLASVLSDWSGEPVPMPQGAFYLWIPVEDGWEYTERLAHDGGALVSPGEFYGPEGARFVRVAVVQPDDRVQLVADRLATARR
jgi:aspartate/methionine/tyrosine aminotransferase